MAKLTIDTGAVGNPATGDTLRTAMTKVNANFTEIYNELGSDGTFSNISFAGNTISTDNTNGDLTIDPNGTGNLVIDATITNTTTNSNITISPNGTGALDVDTSRIINVTDPTSAQDAATKAYVDSQVGGVSPTTFVGDDSTGTAVNSGETFKIAGTQNITTAVSGDTLTITGPDLSSYATTSYVDAQNQSQALTFVGDDSSGTAVNSGETFKIAGTQNVTTAVSGDTLTITGPDLSSYLTDNGLGDLTVIGSTIQSPSNADITLDPSGTGIVRIPTDKIALGTSSNAGTKGVAIGYEAGNSNQVAHSIAIGDEAGKTDQGQNGQNTGDCTIAIGMEAGMTSQEKQAVAIGLRAGTTSQGTLAVALGRYAGNTNQGEYAIAIGSNAQLGTSGTSGNYAISIGSEAGRTDSGLRSIAIGTQTGYANQGEDAIALGYLAGHTNQGANSIVLNASGSHLHGTTASAFFVRPIRNTAGTTFLQYNPTTYEVTYNIPTALTVVGDDSTGTAVTLGETFKIAGTQNVSTAVSGDTLTVTGPDLTNYLQNTGTQTIDNLTFNDNIISTASNADLELDASGTGFIRINAPLAYGVSENDGSSLAIDLTKPVAILEGDSYGAVSRTYTLGNGTHKGQVIHLVIGSDGGVANTTANPNSIQVRFGKFVPYLNGGAVANNVDIVVFSQFVKVVTCFWTGEAWAIDKPQT